jgi:membrane-associated protease RseP (regulator of RpoE activity)
MRHPSFIRRTLGASALSLMFLPAAALADDPPVKPEPPKSAEETENLKAAVEQAAEQALDAAKEAAIEAAEVAQKQATEAAEAATEQAHKIAEQAQKAAQQAAKEAEKAAHEAIKSAKRHGMLNMEQGYQLDLHVTVIPAALNAQLKLEGKGVLVDSVEKDGPAAKAGIQAFDVLVAVDDKPLVGAKELYKSVQASEGKEIAVKLIRSGESQTVKVTPLKHPHVSGDLRLDFNTDVSEEVDIVVSKLEKNIREKLKDAGLDVRMQLIRPGHMLPAGATFVTHARIPDDLSFFIEKKGEQPAEIKIKRGEETWSVTEGKLDSLPPDIRPHVERMLGHGPMPFTMAVPARPMKVPGVPMPPVAIDLADGKKIRADRIHIVGPGGTKQTAERRKGSLEQRLEQMNKNLERMNEQMQALQRELRNSSAEEDEEELKIEIEERDDKQDDDKDE